MTASGFVTGDSGMGHVAITSKDVLGMHSYYTTLFDARLSDFILERIGPMKLRIRFLRVNERHHSVAIANVRQVPADPIRTRIQHVNIQVATLDDMVASFERVTAEGFRMMWSIGQHTNDRELSYYCRTPSGFELEVGLEPDPRHPRARVHLGAHHLRGHLDLGPHPGGRGHRPQADHVPPRRRLPRQHRAHGAAGRRTGHGVLGHPLSTRHRPRSRLRSQASARRRDPARRGTHTGGHEVRVSFADEDVAIAAGYRPCGSCLLPKYRRWLGDTESRRDIRVTEPELRNGS